MTTPRINAKDKGSRNERRVRDHYLKLGAHVVKGGGSLGLFDLVALHPDWGVVLCQVKSNRNPGREEMDRLRAFQCHASWRKILVIVRDRKGMDFYDIDGG